MPPHICNKEAELTEIHDMVQNIDKAIRGNGKPGILTQLAVMKVTLGAVVALNFFVVKAALTDFLAK